MNQEAARRYDAAERAALIGVARAAIEHGLQGGRQPVVDVARHPPRLAEPGASFVTLERDGALRGCIGTLEACRPLVADVAHNAWAAAFADPRFPPLDAAEYGGIRVHISVLTPPVPLPVTGEAELLAALRPGIDGLVLEEIGGRRATFLPAVWAQLPQPREFLAHLKLKAGLPREYWSDTLRFRRYETEVIAED